MTDHKALRLVDVLRDQRQCDEDGVMCIVSRQAVDEAVQIIESLTAAPADHKAEWVERMLGACVPGGSYCDPQRVADAIREYYAVRAAAPAASEGEDGAVATLLTSDPYDDSGAKGPWMHMNDWERLRSLPAGTKLYTRPAAQVAATPKHDEGREAVEAALLDMADAAAKADSSNCTPSQSREQWARYDAAEKIVRRALATQPAARRVTDEELLGAIGRGWCSPENAGKECDVHLAVAILAEIRKMESFAQPAEGVSE